MAWSAAPRLRTLSHPHADRDLRHLSYDYFRHEGRELAVLRTGVRAHAARASRARRRLGPRAVRRMLPAPRDDRGRLGAVEGRRRGRWKRRLSVVRGDLTLTFPLRDNVFGAALAHHVLEHLPPAKERWVLREIHRVLRPAGLLFVASPNTFDPKSRDDPDHINLFAPHGLKKELLAAGFRSVNLAPNYWRSLGAVHPAWTRGRDSRRGPLEDRPSRPIRRKLRRVRLEVERLSNRYR